MRWLTFALVLVAGCSPRTAQVRARGWVVASTPNVELHSDMSGDRAADLASELQGIQDFFAQNLFMCAQDVELPAIRVTALSHAEDIEAMRGEGFGGTYFRQDVPWAHDDLLLYADPGLEQMSVQSFSHELAHRYVALCYPRSPVWLNEGIAETFSTVRIDDDRVLVGAPPFSLDRMFGWRRSGGIVVRAVPRRELPSPSELVSMSIDRFYARDPVDLRARALHYAGAWSFVHMLELGDADLHERFAGYLSQLRRSDLPERELWATAFAGVDLDARANEYRGRSAVTAQWYPRPVRPGAGPSVRELAEVQVHELLGRLFSRSGRAALADEHFALAGAHLMGVAGPELDLELAAHCWRLGRVEQAARHVDRALRRSPESVPTTQAWLALHAASAPRDEAFAAQQARLVERATTPQQLALAARLELSSGRPDAALLLAQRATEQEPTCGECFAALGHAFLVLGDAARAEAPLARAVAQLLHAGDALRKRTAQALASARATRPTSALGSPQIATPGGDAQHHPHGSLPRDEIRRVIGENVHEVRRCMSSLPGSSERERVMVRFRISRTGAVERAEVSESTLESDAIAECIVSAVRGWVFPAPDGGGWVEVNNRFVLTP